MIKQALVPMLALGAFGSTGCTTPVDGAASGCRPAMSIYQPGVNGAPGHLINLPGNCPSPAQLARAAALQPPAPAQPSAERPAAERPVPPDLPSARMAIANGVAQLCRAFLVDGDTTLVAMQGRAFAAGYARGSSVSAVPLTDMLSQSSFSMLGFQARIANAPAEGSGVAGFVGNYHNPVCQIQVYNYPGDAAAFVSTLAGDGWRAIGAESQGGNVAVTRYYGRLGDEPVTLVVNRWAGKQAAPSGLGYIFNVVAGENPTRGALS